MSESKEIEIKFRIEKLRELNRRLRECNFRLVTRRTHEMNTLYDLPGQVLRKRGELLRLRQYGEKWILTHKSKGSVGRHKMRIENETEVNNGQKMESILLALGFQPTFRYEKYRAEWSDGKGHVVVDETPIGDFGEIEGPPRWIDHTARLLQIPASSYLTSAYTELFFQWKRASKSRAKNMTFQDVGAGVRPR